MPRTTVPVDKDALAKAVAELESKNTYTNRSQLYTAVAELYNKTNSPPITFSIACLRIQEYNIEMKTPKGKRGRGVAMTPEHKAALLAARGNSKRKKIKNEADYETMRKRAPESIHGLINKVEEKSAKAAAIKLMCLQCCAYVKREIANCTGKTCGLYDYRPYRNSKGLEIIEDNVEEEEEEEKEVV